MRGRLIMRMRQVLPFTVCVLATIVVCDVSTTYAGDMSSPVTTVALAVRVLVWCVFVGVAAARLFSCSRHAIDGSASSADAASRAVSWGLALEACSLVDASFRLIDVPDMGQSAITGYQLAFWMCSRTISIAAFILLALCLGAFTSRIRSTGLAAVTAVVAYAAVTAAHGALLFHLMRASHPGLISSIIAIQVIQTSPSSALWVVVGGSVGGGICQYANILPIDMRSLGMPAGDTLYAPTIWLNLILAAACLLLRLFAAPHLRTSRVK